ncbi:MAG: sigma-70 family RNA polymerase sigma factor [bacterium]
MKKEDSKHSFDINTNYWIEQYIQNGNKELLGKIYEHYKQQLFSHCLRIMHNQEEANDMTSDAFIKAFENIHTFNPNKPFYPWLCKIATNVCIDRIRRKKAITFKSFNENTDTVKTESTATDIIRKEMTHKIKKIINNLKKPQKRCFCLFYIHQKSYKQISEITGFSYNQVRSHIQNGKRKFKSAMKHKNIV